MVLRGVAFVLALLVLVCNSWAQTGEAPRQFDIPAQPLASALNVFGRQAGLQVTGDATVVSGVQAQAVSGLLTPGEALRRLLAGTGIVGRFTGDRSVILSRPAASGAGVTQLDPVNVESQAATLDPAGYIAKRSVTATKTDTPLMETPQSVSVVTRAQMDVQKPQSVSQALRYTPGITSDFRGAVGRYDVLYARGFGGFYIQYLDGLKIPGNVQYALPQIDPLNLDRIEVFRGPASVLYGQNAPGGMVNLISKRPMAEPFHEVQIQAGTFNRLQGAFDFSGPLDKEGQFLYRFSGFARDAGTQVDYTREQRISLSPALTWRPGPDTTLTFLANFQTDPSQGYFGFVPAQGTFLFSPNGHIPSSFYDGDRGFDWFRRVQRSVGYLFEHRFDETLTVRQNLRYQRVDVNWGRVAGRGLAANLRTLTRQTVTDEESLDAFNVDNQAQLKFDTGPVRHTLLAGVDYMWAANDFKLGAAVAPTLDILNPNYYQPIVAPPTIQNVRNTQSQLGLYAQEQLKFGNLSLLLGGRYDFADSTLYDRLAARTTPKSDRAFTGRVGALYAFDFGVSPYVSYSTSFLPTSGVDFYSQPFSPTSGEQYEAGVKFQPPGWTVYATVSAFDLTQRNVTTPDPAHIGFNVQIGEVRTKGIEVELKANPIPGLNLIGSYTYLDTIVTRSNGTDLGRRPIGIPSEMASLWADYTVEGQNALAGFSVGAGVRYVGTAPGDAANLYWAPGVTLADALISYDFSNLGPQLKGVKFALNVSNLFDTEYVASCASAPNSCYYGSRRTVLGTLSKRW